jgi:predicted HTH domain antitoxin
MITITITTHTRGRKTPPSEEFARELRLAAAIFWYERGRISRGRRAEIAGMSRADFLDASFRAQVPACQVTVEERKEELASWQRHSGEPSTPRP